MTQEEFDDLITRVGESKAHFIAFEKKRIALEEELDHIKDRIRGLIAIDVQCLENVQRERGPEDYNNLLGAMHERDIEIGRTLEQSNDDNMETRC